jgi:hypothetical protein
MKIGITILKLERPIEHDDDDNGVEDKEKGKEEKENDKKRDGRSDCVLYLLSSEQSPNISQVFNN